MMIVWNRNRWLRFEVLMSFADVLKILGGVAIASAGFLVSLPVGLVVVGVLFVVAGWLMED